MKIGIDADIVVYRAAFGAQHTVEGITEAEPEHHATNNCRSIIDSIVNKLSATKVTGYLTASNDPTNYRLYYGRNYASGPTRPKGYKEHRKSVAKPIHYQACRDYVMRRITCDLAIGEEADDRLGIDMTRKRIDCIASLDKDLDMISGKHYNWVKDIIYKIDPLEGLKNFYKQFLIGDSADNICGIKGIGPVGASKLIDHLEEERLMFDVIKETYLDDQKLLDIGRLLWIRREEGQMWEFPK